LFKGAKDIEQESADSITAIKSIHKDGRRNTNPVDAGSLAASIVKPSLSVERSTQSLSSPSQVRILLAEDSLANQLVIKRCISDTGKRLLGSEPFLKVSSAM
jgi:hypothetical protein